MLTLRRTLVTVLTMMVTWSLSLAANLYDREHLQKRSVRSRFQQLQQMQNRFGLSQRQRHRLTDPRNFGNWSMFVPDLPSEDDVDCYVEVEVVHQVGGRCVRLGGERQMMVCQSGMYLDVNSDECQQLTRQREMAYHVQNLNTDSDMGGQIPH